MSSAATSPISKPPSILSQHIRNLRRIVDNWEELNVPGIAAASALANACIIRGATSTNSTTVLTLQEDVIAYSAHLQIITNARADTLVCADTLLTWWTSLRDTITSIRNALSTSQNKMSTSRADVLLDELRDLFLIEVTIRRTVARKLGVSSSSSSSGDADNNSGSSIDGGSSNAILDRDVATASIAAWALRAYAVPTRITLILDALDLIAAAATT
jgi:hypothetical protein